MIIKNEVLKFTENTFKRTTNQTVPSGDTEVLWETQSNSSNSKIYLSNNKIYIHESIKTFWVHLSLYTSNTNYTEYFTEYPAGTQFDSETVYKTATNWSNYANYIYEDNPTNRALFGD